MTQAPNFFTDGAAYERRMGRWSRLVGEEFIPWLAVPPGLRWLDVGCGTGAFTALIVAHGAPAAVDGIDPAEPQLVYARTRSDVGPAQFRQGSAQALPYTDQSFDAAAMALVISFLPDPAKAVSEMVRVVRPGGWVATYMWDGPGGGLPPEPLHAAARSIGAAFPRPPGLEVSRMESLRSLWEQAGLAAIATRVIHIPISYADFDEFWTLHRAPIGPTGKAIEAMAPATRDALAAHLRENLPRDAAGRIAFSAHANAVKGRVRE